jgi:hypothetical protein
VSAIADSVSPGLTTYRSAADCGGVLSADGGCGCRAVEVVAAAGTAVDGWSRSARPSVLLVVVGVRVGVFAAPGWLP